MDGQRVNFYHDRFRPQRPFLPLSTVVLVGLTLLGLLLLVNLGLREHLAAREAEWAGRMGEQRVLATDTAVWEQMRACQTTWDALAATEFRLQVSFGTTLLEQFATLHMPGVRVQRVELSQEGERLLVQGEVTSQMAPRLPEYFQKLARQPILAGRVVQEFQVGKDPSPAPASGGENGQRISRFRLLMGKEKKTP